MALGLSIAQEGQKAGRSRSSRNAAENMPCTRPLEEVTSACNRMQESVRRVELSSEWICIWRHIGGLETRVNVPTQSYRGVNLRANPTSDLFEIVLLHMDPSLEIVLARTSDDTDIIALWRDHARTLCLPLLVEDQQGRLQPVEDASSTHPFARRYGSPLKNRRPRFLSRRHIGLAGEMPQHRGEQELFACI